MEFELLQTLAISLGLGLLVGLQRQHDQARVAGIRTFPLITLFGSLSALLGQEFGGWVVAAGALAVTAMVVTANLMQRHAKNADVGQTTEAAILIMYAVGAYLVAGNTAVAVAVGGTVAVLLHLKGTLHMAVARMGETDLKAIMQFVVISLIILPVLPNREFGPYNVLNPYNIWLMVVLIVGIGLLGYFAYKLFGSKAGTLLAGILGGLISSTATAVTYARRSKSAQQNNQLLALVIFVASVVSVARIITEIAVVSPDSLPQVAPPLIALLLVMILLAAFMYFFRKGETESMPEQENPAHLKTALIFGAVYGAVILATAAAKDHFGSSGLFIVAVISGLTDVDAITLSTSRLMNQETIDLGTGWKIILVAALSNIAFKGALTGMLGNKELFLRTTLLFGISLVAGALIIWLWPSEFVLPFLEQN